MKSVLRPSSYLTLLLATKPFNSLGFLCQQQSLDEHVACKGLRA